MTIKKIGFISFKMKFPEIELVTDPLLTQESGLKFPKTPADVVLVTDPQYVDKSMELENDGIHKIAEGAKGEVRVISSPGEYEVGGVMIRRPVGSDYYLVDEGKIRTLYMGHITKAVAPEKLGDMGDVDVLILPVGNADIFPSFEKIEEIIKRVDPTYLIPCGYKEPDLKPEYKELKTVDEFVKQFGFTHISNEKTFKIKGGAEVENKVVEVVILE